MCCSMESPDGVSIFGPNLFKLVKFGENWSLLVSFGESAFLLILLSGLKFQVQICQVYCLLGLSARKDLTQ